MMRWLKRIGVSLLALAGALYLFGPYEPVETEVTFDPRRLGEGVQVYLESIEAQYDDIRPGNEKRVIWHGAHETRTPISVVYLHGFSASSEEIRPVPDRVADALGANLVFTRFRGHGRDGDALAEATVRDWMADAAEALAVGRATGDKVIVISTSTGSTIAALALMDAHMATDVAGVILISPNFGINNPLAPLLTWPAARYWLPLVAGQRRNFEPRNEGQARHWTTEYPSVAVFPMAAMVKHAQAQDYSEIGIPALFYYSNDDKVIRPDLTAMVEQNWGGIVTRMEPDLQPGDDRYSHVIAGDIMSPGNTAHAAQAILGWIEGLGLHTP